MNDIPDRQNTEKFQRLLRARSQLYRIAARYQKAQLILSVALPIIGAILVSFVAEYRAPVALAALGITLVDVIIIDRSMRRTLVAAARVSEQFDCELLGLDWNSFAAGKRLAPEDVSTAAGNWDGKYELQDWYPRAVGQAPVHIAALMCQLTNLWYDGKLRQVYSTWVAIIGIAGFVIYLCVGLHQELRLTDWANNFTIVAPLLIWGAREFFRQRDTSAAVQLIKSNADCLWDDALAGRITGEQLRVESRAFQNAIFVRRSNNPLLFPGIYWFKRNAMEAEMNAAAHDRLKAMGITTQ